MGGGSTEQDLSSFMSVLIMTIGALTIVLCANTLIIASNPDNLEITSIFVAEDAEGEGNAAPLFENISKEPAYIDLYRDYMKIYPGEVRVLSSELENEDNPFDRLLDKISDNSDKEYVVLLLRPGSALFGRQIRLAIQDRGIDVGQELYEAGKQVNYKTNKLEPVTSAEALTAPKEGEEIPPEPGETTAAKTEGEPAGESPAEQSNPEEPEAAL